MKIGRWCFYFLLNAAVSTSFSVNLVSRIAVKANETKIELCSTANNKAGQCVSLRKCDALFNLLKLRPLSDKNLNYLKRSQCGFVEKEPKVCCAFDDEDNPSLPVVPIPSTVQTVPNPGNVLPGLDVCGMFVDDRLIYGKGNQLGSFPWLALLEYMKPEGKGVHCGGVLISSRYVLTAAHCVARKSVPDNWSLISVRLGEHNRSTDPDCVEVASFRDCGPPAISVPVDSIIVHEKYDYSDIDQYNDIALLRLVKPIMFSEFVSPICLPPAHDEGIGILPFAIAGWGSNQHYEGYDVKQDATLSMKTNADCQSTFAQKNIRGNQLCAARTSDSKDTCHGDSGGPLMSVNPQYSLIGNYFVIGVMSHAPQDCTSKLPIVYTKVRNYYEWIIREMQP